MPFILGPIEEESTIKYMKWSKKELIERLVQYDKIIYAVCSSLLPKTGKDKTKISIP